MNNLTAEQISKLQEGMPCPECATTLTYPPVQNCSCHINPPCSACVDNKLTCPSCGWEQPEIDRHEQSERAIGGGIAERFTKRPGVELGNGKRIFDFDYDSSSGSTMVWRGYYKGDVTAEDIVKYFGVGTFGSRGPSLSNGRFTYTLITD